MDREQNIRAIIDAHFAGFSEEIRDSAVACIMTLKEQPCDDAISRQAAIDAMREETCGCCWDAKDILAHLPSVSTEKTGRWIPVSERLPKEGTYLVCTDDCYIATIMYDRDMGWLLSANIIAWMPLPKPYVPDTNDGKMGESEE